MNPVLDYAPPERPRIDWGKFGFAALPAFWGSVLLGPFFIVLLPIALVGTVILAVRRRWWWLGLTLLLCPMTVSFGRGVVEYWSGTATFEGMGLMRRPANVDPTTRMQCSSGGCLVSGNEWITQDFNNLGVEWMLAWFGTMPGAYDGPYPNEPTAYALITGAKALDLRDLAKDRIVVDGMTITLRHGLGRDLLDGFSQGPAANVSDIELLKFFGEAHAIVHGGRCVIIEIPAAEPGAVGPAGIPIEHRALILLDAVSGKVFAHYFERNFTGYHPRWDTVWR